MSVRGVDTYHSVPKYKDILRINIQYEIVLYCGTVVPVVPVAEYQSHRVLLSNLVFYTWYLVSGTWYVRHTLVGTTVCIITVARTTTILTAVVLP